MCNYPHKKMKGQDTIQITLLCKEGKKLIGVDMLNFYNKTYIKLKEKTYDIGLLKS